MSLASDFLNKYYKTDSDLQHVIVKKGLICKHPPPIVCVQVVRQSAPLTHQPVTEKVWSLRTVMTKSRLTEDPSAAVPESTQTSPPAPTTPTPLSWRYGVLCQRKEFPNQPNDLFLRLSTSPCCEHIPLNSGRCHFPARRCDWHHQQAAHGNMDGPAEQQSRHLQVHLRGRAEWWRGEAQKACEEEEEGATAQTHVGGGAAGTHQPEGRWEYVGFVASGHALSRWTPPIQLVNRRNYNLMKWTYSFSQISSHLQTSRDKHNAGN